MATIKPRPLGRPALLDPTPELRVVWLIPLGTTKAGNPRLPIRVRLSGQLDGQNWHGWPATGKGPKFKIQGYRWPQTEWRLATAEEEKELNDPDRKRDTIPSPAPPKESESQNGGKSEEKRPPPAGKANGVAPVPPS